MSSPGGRRETDHRTPVDVGVLFDPEAEERLARAEALWRAEWRRRAEAMRVLTNPANSVNLSPVDPAPAADADLKPVPRLCG